MSNLGLLNLTRISVLYWLSTITRVGAFILVSQVLIDDILTMISISGWPKLQPRLACLMDSKPQNIIVINSTGIC